jgi:5-formyltetrahydrofolate cyclo-ligase
MDSNHCIDAKRGLRKTFLRARQNLSAADAERFSARIAKHVFSLPRVLESDLVMVYHRLGSEADTGALMELIIASGRGIALPYLRADGSMGIGRIWSLCTDLVPGPYGTMEPADRLKDNVHIDQAGAVVCPGVAFDAAGMRLGRGGGHYDRFLREIKGRAQIIGYAFDCQISGEPLPAEEHDVRMDAVITESRAFPKGSCPAVKLLEEIEEFKESAKNQ